MLLFAVVAVLPLVPLVDELLRDWSPVVLVVELLRDWSPVVADVLLLSDWSPVVVVLSIVTLERPRRSMVGETVEVEPVMEFCESAVEPVTDEVELEVEPVTEGLVEPLTVPGVVDVEPFIVPVLAVLPFVPVDVEAWLSGMQSMWTGLDECCFAFPVDLSACLPAFG